MPPTDLLTREEIEGLMDALKDEPVVVGRLFQQVCRDALAALDDRDRLRALANLAMNHDCVTIEASAEPGPEGIRCAWFLYVSRTKDGYAVDVEAETFTEVLDKAALAANEKAS